MIHTRLRLFRPLIVFDLETTGLNRQTARIVELAFQVFTGEGRQSEWRSPVNPGVPITNASVHGISDATIMGCRSCARLPIEHPHDDCVEFKPVPRFKEIAPRIAKGFSNCDFAGKNIRFDLEVLAEEMRREGVEWSYGGAAVIDADRLEQIGEPRTLSHLYKKHTGKDLEDAHQALVDVMATVEVLTAQLFTYRNALSSDVRELHRLQWPGWIDCEGKFRFNEEGVPYCRFGKHRDMPMKSIPPGYYRWLISADFSSDIKKLANDALIGKFPIDEPLPPRVELS